MNSRMYSHIFLIFFTSLLSLSAFAQREIHHRVYFNNVDEFSGYVEFNTVYAGFATRVHAYDKVLVLTQYHTSSENLEILLKAGYDLRGYPSSRVTPSNYGYVINARAYCVTANDYLALEDSRLNISKGLGDFATPDFSEAAKKRASEYQKSTGKSYWETYGGITYEEVVTLYLSDFKLELQKIIREGKKKKEEQERKEKEEQERKKTSSSSSSKSSSKKEEDNKKQDKEKSSSSSNSNIDPHTKFLWDMESKGDLAMRRGSYREAAKYYEIVRESGGYVNPDKERKALEGAMSESFEELGAALAPHLSDFFEQATGGFVALQAAYAPQELYGYSYSLAANYQGYWNFLSLDMTIGLNYVDSTEFWTYDPYFTLDNPTSTQRTRINDDQIVFRDVVGSKITYSPYRRARSSVNMLLSAGAGFNIPFRGIKPNFMIVGYYNPAFGHLPNFYGYKYLLKVDLWHSVVLGISYNNNYFTKEAFHSSYLTNPYKDRGMDDLDNLMENNPNKFTSIEVSLGIKIINND